MTETGLSFWVTVDRKRALERFSSDELLSEVAARKAVTLPEERQLRDDALQEAMTEAIGYLKSGRADDALLVLERCAFPKFKSFDEATARYLRAVSR